MSIRTDSTLILLVFGIVTSGSGCQVLGIPSYRAENGTGSHLAGSGIECLADAETCPPGIFPPLPTMSHFTPGCLARWKAQRELPEPSAYPRFHPLPTRPMFSSGPNQIPFSADMGMPVQNTPYGQLPEPQKPDTPVL